MNEMSAPRTNMVNSQIMTNKVTDDRVTAALLSVPREKFVPKAMAGVAYVDEQVEVGGVRFIMAPMTFARMVQAADVTADDLVLDGTFAFRRAVRLVQADSQSRGMRPLDLTRQGFLLDTHRHRRRRDAGQ